VQRTFQQKAKPQESPQINPSSGATRSAASYEGVCHQVSVVDKSRLHSGRVL